MSCIATTRPPRRWVVQRMDGVRRTTRRAENAKKRKRLIRNADDRLKRGARSPGGLCSPNTYTHRLRSARDLWGDSGLWRRSRLRTVLSCLQPPAVLCCPDTYTQRHAAANLPCEDLYLLPICSFGDKSSVRQPLFYIYQRLIILMNKIIVMSVHFLEKSKCCRSSRFIN